MFLANRCEDYPLLESFVKGSLIKNICKNILGEKIYLFNEQVVNKEPQTDSKFAWHQDSGYVGHDHKPYLSIWIALCNTNEFNGALRILPINLARNKNRRTYLVRKKFRFKYKESKKKNLFLVLSMKDQ